MTPRRTCAPEQILAPHPPAVRQLAERLRGLVRAAVPDVVEAGYPGWRLIGYRAPSGYLCFIAPFEDHVRLGFEYGASLRDPAALLEGPGSQVRHVALRPGRPVPERQIRALLEEALRDVEMPLELRRAPVRRVSRDRGATSASASRAAASGARTPPSSRARRSPRSA